MRVGEADEVRGLIAAEREALREARARARKAQAEVTTRERHLARLRERLGRLRSPRAAKPRRAAKRHPPRPVATLSRRQMAGEANIDAVVRTLREHGPLPQAELSRLSGVGTGTITHALRALEEDGAVEPTGERVGVSRVFRLAKGSRRSTTFAPGSGG